MEKYVDESWKDSVEEEKRKAKLAEKSPPGKEAAPDAVSGAKQDPAGPPPEPETEISFLEYLSSLAYQAMIFLGDVPHPATNMPEKNLGQAKIFIDTLVLLRGKTKGNLTKQEEDALNTSIYELQMRFLELMQKEEVSHDR